MAKLIRQTRNLVSSQHPRFRVWHAFNPPHNMDYYAVESVDEAKALLTKLIAEDLADSFVEANAFGLEELEENDYCEWYDEEGRSITDLMDEEDQASTERAADLKGE